MDARAGYPKCPACAQTVQIGGLSCPYCGFEYKEPFPPPPQDPLKPKCPLCAEPIQPGARKCPHCKEYLDPALARQERAALGSTVQKTLVETEIREKLLHSVIASAIGTFLFCGLGPLLGPIVFGYGMYYRSRLRAVDVEPPATLKILFGIAAAWFVLGIAGIIAIVVVSMNNQ